MLVLRSPPHATWLGLLLISSFLALATASVYFPETVKLPHVNREINSSHDPSDPHLFSLQGLNGHPARFLDVNYTRARYYNCPWAFVPSLSGASSLFGSRLFARASSPLKSRGRASSVCMTAAPKQGAISRRSVLGGSMGGSMALALWGISPEKAGAAFPFTQSIKDISQKESEERSRNAAQRAAMATRPKELRNEESCYMWNGKKECFSCKKSCESWKSVTPDLDCEQYCTVQYGAPKPTDEDSISFNQFVDLVNKGSVTRVDFYGPAGDRAYATLQDAAAPIRVGEGFPMEIGNEPSSPLQVVRLLKLKEVPYKFHFLDNVTYQKIG